MSAANGPPPQGRNERAKSLPKRVYRHAEAAWLDGRHVVALDGAPALTPGRARLALPTPAAAQAVAREWDDQIEVLDPELMPLTRLANAALDGVARSLDTVRADIVNYAGSDLLCYRAEAPEALVRAQSEAWDPILAWAREEIGADFRLAGGVVFVDQPEAAIGAVRAAVAAVSAPFALAGLHVMTSLMGSALLALAVARDRLSAAAAWRAAHVDEDFEILTWGVDAEAMARRERRWRDMQAAAFFARMA